MLKLIFPGHPMPQQRCRIFKRGPKICSFDPQTRLKVELKISAKEQLDDHNKKEPSPWTLPQYPKINFLFFMPIPKYMPKKERVFAELETLKHIKKPDVDNLIKLYLDVLSNIVIHDDASVQIGKAIKMYSLNPRTVILIQEMGKTITNYELYGQS